MGKVLPIVDPKQISREVADAPHEIPASVMMNIEKSMFDKGVRPDLLMETAGVRIAGFIASLVRFEKDPKIVFVCGKGNNAGDGFSAARHLLSRGIISSVITCSTLEEGTLAANRLDMIKESDVRIKAWDQSCSKLLTIATIVVDCLLGTGVEGNPRPPYDTIIEEINNSKKPILSIDTPSGLNTESGQPQSPTTRPQSTLSLGLPKNGLSKYGGQVFVADIGLDPSVIKGQGVEPIEFGQGAIVHLKSRKP